MGEEPFSSHRSVSWENVFINLKYQVFPHRKWLLLLEPLLNPFDILYLEIRNGIFLSNLQETMLLKMYDGLFFPFFFFQATFLGLFIMHCHR